MSIAALIEINDYSYAWRMMRMMTIVFSSRRDAGQEQHEFMIARDVGRYHSEKLLLQGRHGMRHALQMLE